MKASKSPLKAFVMSCLVAGWGLVYVGRVKWALQVAALLYIGIVLLGISGLAASPAGLVCLLVIVVLVKLGSATAAALLARKDNNLTPGPSVRFHTLYVAVLVAITAALLGPLRTPLLGFKTDYIPSGSMIPTLAIGDYIVSDMHPGTLKVGDMVIYNYNGTEALKRVAGLGGDTLAIVDGNLIRNGENLGLFFAPQDRVKKDYSLQLASLKVERDHVYLLGDNRDVSNDSRFMGQVALQDIKGKVTGIWFSAERSRIFTTFH